MASRPSSGARALLAAEDKLQVEKHQGGAAWEGKLWAGRALWGLLGFPNCGMFRTKRSREGKLERAVSEEKIPARSNSDDRKAK